MSASIKNQREITPTRSPDFKYIPCDALSMAVGNDGLKLLMGVTEIDGGILELVGVHFSRNTAKSLQLALAKALDDLEEDAG